MERAGRREAVVADFDAFVRAAYGDLVRLAFLLLGDRSLGEDLAQATLMKVFLRWDRIAAKGAAGSYARAVMVRLALRWRHRRWNAERPTDPWRLRGEADRANAADAGEADVVVRALMGLPAGQRAVLVLRYFEDYSEAEIARTLRIPVGTVKSRASRGVETLRGTVDRAADSGGRAEREPEHDCS